MCKHLFSEKSRQAKQGLARILVLVYTLFSALHRFIGLDLAPAVSRDQEMTHVTVKFRI